MKKVVALIQARVNSTRLPQKVLLPIEDKMLVEHVIEKLKNAETPDEVIMCTSTHPDDSVLIDIARKNNIGWAAGSEEDVLDRFIHAAGQTGADVVIRATGENPLTDPVYLDRAVREHVEQGAEYTSVNGLPAGIRVEVMDTAALEKAHNMADNPTKSEYMTLYFQDDFFKVCFIDAAPDVNRPDYRLTVDTSEDMELMRRIYKNLYRSGTLIPLEDVINFLDNNPELAAINQTVTPKNIKREIIGGDNPRIRIVVEGV